MTDILAKSGYWADIQDAVNQARSGDNVFIPEGTFDFVNVGEELGTLSGGYYLGSKVTIPAGVNLFGAPTQRNAKGQVVEWKTILRLPWDAHGTWHYDGCQWFKFIGNGDPNKPSRFSDIKQIGYRSINSSSVTTHCAVKAEGIIDFRIDHCYFEHTCSGISISRSRGVIDHCFLVNSVGKVGTTLDMCTVFYGVGMGRGSGDLWENDVSKVLGKYTDYTVFIEDCYFEKWRHCVAANSGAHYVFRYCTIKDDFGYGSLDAHGWGTMSGGVITQVGTRAIEIYNCTIIDAIQSPWATFIRGGAGVAFNNTVGGGTYRDFIYFSNEAQAEVSKCWINDWWIWNNTLLSGITEIIKYDPLGNIIEGVNYFRYAPHTFSYQPYPYPHPLVTSETPPPTTPTTPFSGELEEGTYAISVPTNVTAGSDTYIFKQWEDGSTNPVRQVNLNQDLAFTVTYEKVTVDLTINVNDLTMGTTDPIPGIHKITQGSTVQISAIPSTGYMFDHWELDGVTVGTSSPYSVTMNTDHAILAVFIIKPPPPPGKQHLTISSTTGGTTTPAAGVWEHDEGSTAQVTATPNTGYIFKHWLFDNVIAGTDPTTTVLMDADHTLVAVFEAVPPTPRLWTWPFLTWLRNLIRQGQG